MGKTVVRCFYCRAGRMNYATKWGKGWSQCMACKATFYDFSGFGDKSGKAIIRGVHPYGVPKPEAGQIILGKSK